MVLLIRVWQIAATYMGAIIGAGYASGQELLRFFVVFGAQGIAGVFFSGFLFAILGALVVFLTYKLQVKSYEELMVLLFGVKLGKWVEIIIGLMLWVGLTVMLAGSGTVFTEYWQLDKSYGIGLTLIVIITALFFKGSGVKWLNSMLIPFLIVISAYVSIYTIYSVTNQVGSDMIIDYGYVGNSWLRASVIYVAYNMVLGIVILASIDKIDKKASLIGTIVGGALLGCLGMIMVMALLKYFPLILQFQIPMLFLAGQMANWLKLLFTLALWSAMVTTAVANGFGLIKRLENTAGFTYGRAMVLILASSLPLTKMDFAQLVGVFYPIFGYIGLLLVGMIITRMIIIFFHSNSRKIS